LKKWGSQGKLFFFINMRFSIFIVSNTGQF
jgi:hypothetical protein